MGSNYRIMFALRIRMTAESFWEHVHEYAEVCNEVSTKVCRREESRLLDWWKSCALCCLLGETAGSDISAGSYYKGHYPKFPSEVILNMFMCESSAGTRLWSPWSWNLWDGWKGADGGKRIWENLVSNAWSGWSRIHNRWLRVCTHQPYNINIEVECGSSGTKWLGIITMNEIEVSLYIALRSKGEVI